jgi:hypothetical protein
MKTFSAGFDYTTPFASDDKVILHGDRYHKDAS